ncbi:hypothetical protein [Pseudonocardia sp. Ae505_Ps2]|uniref:hypothetical protein n=1 Tax=Pseudonocardia sp. Ae505_Ps2 TaxID=1885034 RepID=UPI00094EDA3D|nr:hypothetical protein [Pseudonocardia sp. Ae505_Ps2]OLM08352.1 hypothetical protein Ae505Ps2_6206 [Pseudonocardia sp. Ae505_Ps2]
MSTCTHPGAHVHGLIGSGPVAVSPEKTQLALAPAEWGHLSGPLRPGERMSAAIGACSSCGALVVSVGTWHPTDGCGEHAVEYRTPWTAMYGPNPAEAVPADPAARPPLRATLVGLGSQDLTPRG